MGWVDQPELRFWCFEDFLKEFRELGVRISG